MELADVAAAVFAGRPITRIRAEDGDTQLPILGIRDVSTRLAAREHLEVVQVRQSPELEKFALRAQDVVVTARGATVRAAVAEAQHFNVLAGANLIVIRLRGFSPHLLAAYLRHAVVQSHLLQASAGSGTMGFTVEGLKRLELNNLGQRENKHLAELAEAVERYALYSEQAADLRRKATAEAVFRRLWPTP